VVAVAAAAAGSTSRGRPGGVRWSSRAGGVAVALLADRLIGEPPAAIHPVVAFGRLMAAVEHRWWHDGRRAGTVHAATGVGVGVVGGVAAARLVGSVRATVAVAELTTAGRALADAAGVVGAELRAGRLDAARRHLPALVGRDPRLLDAAEVARAVVESVAENTVDAVVAPALWALVAGAPGAAAYRAVNTLDAMVGHRTDRYRRYGWASARLDDVANWVPARATALLVAAVRPARAGAVWRAVRTQAPAHPSPNAGVAEAAFAAALGIRLGGTNTYGDRVEHRAPLGMGPPAGPDDIGRATVLSRDVTLALAAALAVPAGLGWCRRRGRSR